MRFERLWMVLLVVAIIMGLYQYQKRPLVHPEGVLVQELPLQEPVQPMTIRMDDFELTRKARFQIRARVLSRKNYSMDRGADIAPVDLALGWGPRSDQAVLDQLEVRQSGRWYHLRWENPPPSPEYDLLQHSANMHLIPAENFIEGQLKSIRAGEVVELSGFLVDVVGDRGFTWKSSMTRNDRGGGSCELFLVERVYVN